MKWAFLSTDENIVLLLNVVRAGEIVPLLIALAALLEDLYLEDSSQLSVTPALGDQMPSSGFHGYCMHMVNRHTSRQNNNRHTILKN